MPQRRRQVKRRKRSRSLPTYLHEEERPLGLKGTLEAHELTISASFSSSVSSSHNSELQTPATERTASGSSRSSKQYRSESRASAQLCFALREFIVTEYNYLNCLHDLVQVYMSQLYLAIGQGIQLQDYKLIDRNLNAILHVHQDVWDIVVHAFRHLNIEISMPLPDNLVSGIRYHKLQELTQCICQDFWQLADQLQVYGPYCAGQADAQRTLSRLDRKFDWSRFEQSCQHRIVSNRTTMTRLTLRDYLIMPVQRICRYPLLFSEISKSCPPATALQYVVNEILHTFRDIIDETNAQARYAEDNRIAQVIASRIDPANNLLPKEFVKEIGQVILSGAMRVIRCPQSDDNPLVERYCAVFIYLEYIIIADVRRRDLYEPLVCLSMKDPAVHLDKVSRPLGTADGIPAFSVRIHRHAEIIQLTASSLEEYEVWMNAIHMSAAGRKDELYMERKADYKLGYSGDSPEAVQEPAGIAKAPLSPTRLTTLPTSPLGSPSSRFWLYPRKTKGSNAVPLKFVREAEVEAVHLKLRDVLSMEFVNACARPDYKDKVAKKLVRKKSADAVMTLRSLEQMTSSNTKPHNKSVDSLLLLGGSLDSPKCSAGKSMRLQVKTDVVGDAPKRSTTPMQTPATTSTCSDTSSPTACVTPPSSSLMSSMRSIFSRPAGVNASLGGSAESPLSPFSSQDYLSPRSACDDSSRGSSPQQVRGPSKGMKRFWSGTK